MAKTDRRPASGSALVHLEHILPKVLCRLRHHVCKELDLHATNFLQEKGDVILSPRPLSTQRGSSNLRHLAQPVSGGLEGAPQLPPLPESSQPAQARQAARTSPGRQC